MLAALQPGTAIRTPSRFASNIKLGPVTHTVLVALMITVLGLIYLTQATERPAMTTKPKKSIAQIAELTKKRLTLKSKMPV